MSSASRSRPIGRPRNKSLKTSVLLIGGPPADKLKSLSARHHLEQIECDIAGVLGHPASRAFCDFGAVVFWPNRRLFALPATFKQWEAARSTSRGRLPAIHQSVWATGNLEDEPNWEHRPGCGLEDQVTHVWEAVAIRRQLEQICIRRLREEIVGGFRSGLVSVVVVPNSIDTIKWAAFAPFRDSQFWKITGERTPPTFEWLSRALHTSENSERRRSSLDGAFLDTCKHTRAENMLAHIQDALPNPSPRLFSLRENAEDGSKEVDNAFSGRNWGAHWIDAHDPEVDAPAVLQDTAVQIFTPHSTGVRSAATLLFVPEYESSSTHTNGFALVLPEPEDPVALLRAIFKAIKSHAPSPRATSQLSKGSAPKSPAKKRAVKRGGKRTLCVKDAHVRERIIAEYKLRLRNNPRLSPYRAAHLTAKWAVEEDLCERITYKTILNYVHGKTGRGG